ncbi:hypothetical protein [Streptomyces sp. NPDC014685]|uniref:hypothetical protein n=1 Tax=Streptomyces sp. NPDC014685 TaxID=3364881 RepID=UPI0036FA01C4
MGGPLRKYRYRGTVMKLNDQDAARLGLGENELVGGPPAETVELPDGPPEKARGAAANKARTAAPNKGGRAGRRKPTTGETGTDGGEGGGADGGG